MKSVDSHAKDCTLDDPSEKPKLRIVTALELLEMEVTELEYLLKPIIREQGTGMLWAYRGVGKTWMALGISAAIASGRNFLCWKTPKPAGVLYIDGELPLRGIKERVEQMISGFSQELAAPFHILTQDMQEFGLPDLSTRDGQRQLMNS